MCPSIAEEAKLATRIICPALLVWSGILLGQVLPGSGEAFVDGVSVQKDRGRALAMFLIATPVAQIASPKISNALLKIGTDDVINGVALHHPELFGMEGWQWVYIFWGVPAVVLGIVVLFILKDRPRDAKWLTAESR